MDSCLLLNVLDFYKKEKERDEIYIQYYDGIHGLSPTTLEDVLEMF